MDKKSAKRIVLFAIFLLAFITVFLSIIYCLLLYSHLTYHIFSEFSSFVIFSSFGLFIFLIWITVRQLLVYYSSIKDDVDENVLYADILKILLKITWFFK